MFRVRRALIHQYYAAWVALLSMLLLVIAPLISQLQSADHVAHPPSPFQSGGTRHLQLSPHSSDSEHYGHTHKSSSEHDERDVVATDRDTRGGSPVHVADPSSSRADHDPLTHALEACGYCFLLANSPALGGALNAAFAFPSGTGQLGDTVPASQAPRTAPYVRHRPRGPPPHSQFMTRLPSFAFDFA